MDFFSIKRFRTLILIVFSFICFYACENDTPTGENLPIEELLSSDMELVVNPNGITPLSALLTFSTVRNAQIEVTVDGLEPISHTFADLTREHAVPILGLYADTINEVSIKITDSRGNFAETTLTATTDALDDTLFPDIEYDVAPTNLVSDGWLWFDFSQGEGESFASVPFVVDNNGDIRYVLDLGGFDDMSAFPVQQTDRGTLLIAFEDMLYEYDMLGNELNSWSIAGFEHHHETRIKPNGNLLLAVNNDAFDTLEDYIIEITPSGAIVNEWDLRQILDMDRNLLIPDPVDWVHVNAIWYDETDDALIISGQRQGIFKVSANNELIWILAPHLGWGQAGINGDGFNTANYLLTAIDGNGVPYDNEVQLGNIAADDFDWPFGQHAPLIMDNGDILLYDNGLNRHFIQQQPTYSRAVQYRVDEENMTVRQIWQYGKERGTEIQSWVVSDVDVLPNDNILMTNGILFFDGGPVKSRVIELTYPDKNIAAEIVLTFKNSASGGALGWGGTDIIYRAERLHLYR